MTTMTVQSGQDSWKMAAGTGQPWQDAGVDSQDSKHIQDRKERTGRPEYDSEDKTARTEQPEWDIGGS
jgi:hypothetical protein